MEAKGISFTEAILDLAATFNIQDEITRSINRPDIRREPATAEQPEGDCTVGCRPEFTKSQLCHNEATCYPGTHGGVHWYRVKRTYIGKEPRSNPQVLQRELSDFLCGNVGLLTKKVTQTNFIRYTSLLTSIRNGDSNTSQEVKAAKLHQWTV